MFHYYYLSFFQFDHRSTHHQTLNNTNLERQPQPVDRPLIPIVQSLQQNGNSTNHSHHIENQHHQFSFGFTPSREHVIQPLSSPAAIVDFNEKSGNKMPAVVISSDHQPDASRKRRFINNWNQDVDLTDSTSSGSLSPKIYINSGNVEVNGVGEKSVKKGKFFCLFIWFIEYFSTRGSFCDVTS